MQIVMKVVDVKGMAHITGGGITDNFPRILPAGHAGEIDLQSWKVPPLFTYLQQTGNVAESEMLRTFNMGLGFLFVVPRGQADKAMETVSLTGTEAYRVGEIIAGEPQVHYKGTLNHG
jgi:phosphoribosylformylglycinamidine cyclo-ligase